MGNCKSKFSKREFINETLYHLRRNNVKIYDENNNIIPENEIIKTLEGIHKRQTIHYYNNLRCKPKMLELFLPSWFIR